ncbi:hypothetical protein IMZ48_32410 [Candidatus Bathyarchaeota archaeon]|nr:hypothetical protein [Candidatus Bathyarchaeota archaeon]
MPTAEQQASMPEFRMGNTPRYLFRIHAPPSAGTTTTSYVIPPASGCDDPGLRADIFSLPPVRAAELLHNHSIWLPSHEDECNFTSWTSSLLFALQYGFYRHRGDTMKIRSQLSKISLMVIDTRGLPAGTFVKDVEIMRAITSDLSAGEGDDLRQFLDFRENPRRSGRYYFGEYLSQGDLGLEGRCAQTSMTKLKRFRLFDLQPGFEDQEGWTLWAKRVIALRKPFEQLGLFSDVPPTDRRQIRRAIVLASACFGDRFAVPVAAMLLALQPRKGGDPDIIQGFAAIFTGKKEHIYACSYRLLTNSR